MWRTVEMTVQIRKEHGKLGNFVKIGLSSKLQRGYGCNLEILYNMICKFFVVDQFLSLCETFLTKP